MTDFKVYFGNRGPLGPNERIPINSRPEMAAAGSKLRNLSIEEAIALIEEYDALKVERPKMPPA